MEVLGIDIGSYGIKGGIIDTRKGKFVSDKYNTEPIEDISPHKILSLLHGVVKHFSWKGPIGCAFPAPIRKGIVLSTERVDDSWINADAAHLMEELTDSPVVVINDTDATGIAEMRFGAGKDQMGVVIVLTVGTGIGSSLFVDGKLVPNTELGHIEVKGISIEERASNRARKEEGIRKKAWARRLHLVLQQLEDLFHPDLFVLGGQISRKANKTFPYIKIQTPFDAAQFQNEASIIGAALCAADTLQDEKNELTPQ